jgi:hypothetical protein
MARREGVRVSRWKWVRNEGRTRTPPMKPTLYPNKAAVRQAVKAEI